MLACLDFTKEEWIKLYDKLMGGFVDLGTEDFFSSEEDIDPALKTKSGYLKDGFVVEDNALGDGEGEEDDDYILGESSNTDSEAEAAEDSDGANYGDGTDDEEEAVSLPDLSDDDTGDGDDEAENTHGSELSEEEYCYK